MSQFKNPIYEKWHKLVDTWKSSGLSQPKFCEENQICFAKFKYYRQKFRTIDKSQNIISVVPKAGQSPSFEAIKLMSPAPPSLRTTPVALSIPAVKVTLRNGVSLDITEGFSTNHLKSLVGVLEQC